MYKLLYRVGHSSYRPFCCIVELVILIRFLHSRILQGFLILGLAVLGLVPAPSQYFPLIKIRPIFLNQAGFSSWPQTSESLHLRILWIRDGSRNSLPHFPCIFPFSLYTTYNFAHLLKFVLESRLKGLLHQFYSG